MIQKKMRFALVLVVGLLVLQGAVSMAATASNANLERASWMLDRGNWNDFALTGVRYEQGSIGESEDALSFDGFTPNEGVSGNPGLSMLASLVLPGAGEALMGYKRGYAMMAVDIYAWTKVASNHSDGNDLRDKYYAYADEHYSDENLVLAYAPCAFYPRACQGMHYFSAVVTNPPITDVDDLEKLSLYVSVEDDRREYYENLGKWDQFIFGWDDYTRPDSPPAGIEYELTNTTEDLHQPWVSEHRGIYRQMRDDSNDAFKSRDRWMYVNIGMRVFSVLQVAYLSGMLGGSDSLDMQVAGHSVQLLVQPRGMTAGTVAAAVEF